MITLRLTITMTNRMTIESRKTDAIAIRMTMKMINWTRWMSSSIPVPREKLRGTQRGIPR